MHGASSQLAPIVECCDGKLEEQCGVLARAFADRDNLAAARLAEFTQLRQHAKVAKDALLDLQNEL